MSALLLSDSILLLFALISIFSLLFRYFFSVLIFKVSILLLFVPISVSLLCIPFHKFLLVWTWAYVYCIKFCFIAQLFFLLLLLGLVKYQVKFEILRYRGRYCSVIKYFDFTTNTWLGTIMQIFCFDKNLIKVS